LKKNSRCNISHSYVCKVQTLLPCQHCFIVAKVIMLYQQLWNIATSYSHILHDADSFQKRKILAFDYFKSSIKIKHKHRYFLVRQGVWYLCVFVMIYTLSQKIGYFVFRKDCPLRYIAAERLLHISWWAPICKTAQTCDVVSTLAANLSRLNNYVGMWMECFSDWYIGCYEIWSSRFPYIVTDFTCVCK